MSKFPTRNVEIFSKYALCRCPLVNVIGIMRKEVMSIFRQLKTYVSGITYQRVKAYCKVNDITQSELIRVAVVEYLNKKDFQQRRDI